MLPLVVGECYAIHTPIWGYIGRVKELGPTHVTFSPCVQVHHWGDFPSAIATGRFASAQLSPIAGDWFVPLWMIVGGGPWPHPLPMKRTHPPISEEG